MKTKIPSPKKGFIKALVQTFPKFLLGAIMPLAVFFGMLSLGGEVKVWGETAVRPESCSGLGDCFSNGKLYKNCQAILTNFDTNKYDYVCEVENTASYEVQAQTLDESGKIVTCTIKNNTITKCTGSDRIASDPNGSCAAYKDKDGTQKVSCQRGLITLSDNNSIEYFRTDLLGTTTKSDSGLWIIKMKDGSSLILDDNEFANACESRNFDIFNTICNVPNFEVFAANIANQKSVIDRNCKGLTGAQLDNCKNNIKNNLVPITGVIDSTKKFKPENCKEITQEVLDKNKITDKSLLGKFDCDGTLDAKGMVLTKKADNTFVSADGKEYGADGNLIVRGGNATGAGAKTDLFKILMDIVSAVLVLFIYFAAWIATGLLFLLGTVFMMLIRTNPVGADFITAAVEPWKVVVSIANLLAISSFIFVGFGYILNIKSLKVGLDKFLMNVAVYTLAILFTLFGSTSVVNVSQGIGDVMLFTFAASKGTTDPNQALLGTFIGSMQRVSIIRCGNISSILQAQTGAGSPFSGGGSTSTPSTGSPTSPATTSPAASPATSPATTTSPAASPKAMQTNPNFAWGVMVQASTSPTASPTTGATATSPATTATTSSPAASPNPSGNSNLTPGTVKAIQDCTGSAANNGDNWISDNINGIGSDLSQYFSNLFSGQTGTMTAVMMTEAIYLFLVIIAIIVFFKLILQILWRNITLWLLIIVSPLALAAYISPFPSLKKYGNQWMDLFWKATIFYPAFVFGMIIAAVLSSSFGVAMSQAAKQNAINSGWEGLFANFAITVMIGVISIAVLWVLVQFFEKAFEAVAKAMGTALGAAWGAVAGVTTLLSAGAGKIAKRYTLGQGKRSALYTAAKETATDSKSNIDKLTKELEENKDSEGNVLTQSAREAKNAQLKDEKERLARAKQSMAEVDKAYSKKAEEREKAINKFGNRIATAPYAAKGLALAVKRVAYDNIMKMSKQKADAAEYSAGAWFSTKAGVAATKAGIDIGQNLDDKNIAKNLSAATLSNKSVVENLDKIRAKKKGAIAGKVENEEPIPRALLKPILSDFKDKIARGEKLSEADKSNLKAIMKTYPNNPEVVKLVGDLLKTDEGKDGVLEAYNKIDDEDIQGIWDKKLPLINNGSKDSDIEAAAQDMVASRRSGAIQSTHSSTFGNKKFTEAARREINLIKNEAERDEYNRILDRKIAEAEAAQRSDLGKGATSNGNPIDYYQMNVAQIAENGGVSPEAARRLNFHSEEMEGKIKNILKNPNTTRDQKVEKLQELASNNPGVTFLIKNMEHFTGGADNIEAVQDNFETIVAISTPGTQQNIAAREIVSNQVTQRFLESEVDLVSTTVDNMRGVDNPDAAYKHRSNLRLEVQTGALHNRISNLVERGEFKPIIEVSARNAALREEFGGLEEAEYARSKAGHTHLDVRQEAEKRLGENRIILEGSARESYIQEQVAKINEERAKIVEEATQRVDARVTATSTRQGDSLARDLHDLILIGSTSPYETQNGSNQNFNNALKEVEKKYGPDVASAFRPDPNNPNAYNYVEGGVLRIGETKVFDTLELGSNTANQNLNLHLGEIVRVENDRR